MRILLIDPPMQSIMLARADWFPMGLCYLAGSLKQAGHLCLVYNGEHDPTLDYQNLQTYSDNYHLYLDALNDPSHLIWQTLSAIIADFGPDVIGITAFSVKFSAARRIAALAKSYDKTIPVVMGGQHATIMTNDVLNCPDIDFVVRGEGERTIVELIEQIEGGQHWEAIDGLSYKSSGQIIHNRDRMLNMDLDSLAMPDRGALYDAKIYIQILLRRYSLPVVVLLNAPIVVHKIFGQTGLGITHQGVLPKKLN
jgi:anaerobic magnesium-protoporphyrin IX monomethyl ester cyclase